MSGISATESRKLEQLLSKSYDYLIENFHKFTETNKTKIALALVSRRVPNETKSVVEGEITHTITDMDLEERANELANSRIISEN